MVKRGINRKLSQAPIFKNQFTGFSLYDLNEGAFIMGFNETKRFTPASNVKILTMYVSLKSFDQTIPGMLYQESNDSLWVQPIGDPTFLDNRFPSQPVFDFLKDRKKIIHVIWPSQKIEPFGSGWAWDDYRYDFQSSRNWWPMYNNMIHVSRKKGDISITPNFFTDYIDILENQEYGNHFERDSKYNVFTLATHDTSQFERSIPFEWSEDLILSLLRDTLKAPVTTSFKSLSRPDTIQSQNLDHVLALMMKASDNHLAEQLLIMAAWKNGNSSIQSFINRTKRTWLNDLTDFVWVDGSGLSRYNLIAPIDQVRLLKKASEEFGMDRLTRIMAVGGESGTLRNWYGAEEPYVFAKSGTLSNNHSLSGFLKTKSGKWLVFSFMNNHYIVSHNKIRTEMQEILERIRDTY